MKPTRTSACFFIASALLVSIQLGSSAEDQSILEAQKLFKLYTEFEHAYDPAQAELFSPSAAIKDTRIYQDGQNKTLSWTGENYQRLIKAQLPVSKARAEQFTYSAPTFTKEGNNVRMRCTRSSNSKKFVAPFEMVFAMVGTGKASSWKIVEETMQSQP